MYGGENDKTSAAFCQEFLLASGTRPREASPDTTARGARGGGAIGATELHDAFREGRLPARVTRVRTQTCMTFVPSLNAEFLKVALPRTCP